MIEYIFKTSEILLLNIFLIVMTSTYFIIQKLRPDPNLEKFSKYLPGPTGLPLMGNTLPFVFSGLGGVNGILHQYTKKFGSIYKLWFGNELVVVLSDIEYLEIIFGSMKTLSRPTNLFNGYKETFGSSLFTATVFALFVHVCLGENVASVDEAFESLLKIVPVWRQTRKQLQPIFGKNAIKFQIPSLHEYIEKYVDLVEKNHINGPEFNVKDYMQDMVIDSFLGIYYDVHLTSKQKEYFKFREILISSSTYAFAKMIFPWLRIKHVSKLYLGNQKEKFEKKLKEFFKLLNFTNACQTDKSFDNTEKLAKSLLSTIRKLEEDIKIEDYAFNESANFIIAVMGTTASTISSCLLAIAMHPEVQNKLSDELKQVLGDGTRPAYPMMSDLSKLKYLDQVVKETQRRFTIIKDISREVEEDIQIGSMMVPKRAVIMIRIVEIHMNPSLYPNPEEFNPENFSPEAIRTRSKYAHLPHSSGIRDCIGKHLAENIIKLTVISFLRNFRLSTSIQMTDIDYTGALIGARPKGFWIRTESLEPRT